MRPGTVMTVEWELDGVRFVGINGGPQFKFDEAVSFQIDCKDQAEVDYFWEKLSEGGEEGPCGWLKDRYGLSWQVVPAGHGRALQRPRPEEGTAGDAGDAEDGQARRRSPPGGGGGRTGRLNPAPGSPRPDT